MKQITLKKILRKILFKEEKSRFYYQKKYIDFDIKEGEKVLDIGSGNYPFPLATHLAGLSKDRVERQKGDKRPFIECNVEDMPFKDKEFDFVYCSHVLEHVEDPAKACDEIMRVGKRGYIEIPTRTSDIMFNFTGIKNHHKWHVSLAGNSLIFIEWMDREKRDTGINYFFKKFQSRFWNPFQALVHNNQDLFVNMFLWEERFNYYIFDKNGNLINFRKNDESENNFSKNKS